MSTPTGTRSVWLSGEPGVEGTPGEPRPDHGEVRTTHGSGLVTVLIVVMATLAGCATGANPTTTASAPNTTIAPTTTETSIEFDQELHDELMAMLQRDQDGRLGGTDPEGDIARTERLKEIVEEHGWPTIALVGEDGEDAAWAIAQHSDLDPEFQAMAVELLREAVADGQASPGNLAYLEDRVLAGKGEPQVYGTQIACRSGGAEPATPIVDEASVDDRRLAAGLDPLADYLEEMAEICAEDS